MLLLVDLAKYFRKNEMKIRWVKISNFRGITECECLFPIDAKFICLIGAGDSGKTTFLEALYWLLGERWSLPIAYSDFNDSEKPVVISAAITCLPCGFIEMGCHGLHLSGIDPNGCLSEEPIEGFEECASVRLTVDCNTYEPSWEVYRGDEAWRLSSGDRAKLGVFKLDDQSDLHLRWGVSSALGRLSKQEADLKPFTLHVAEASRKALRDCDVPEDMSALLDKVKDQAAAYGSAPYGDMRIGLDERAVLSKGLIALCSNDVPVANYGLGSKRLSSIAVQRLAAAGMGTLLIDEIETALEPHRVKSLIHLLREDEGISQIFATSHSDAVVEFCECSELFVCSPEVDKLTIRPIPGDMAALHRAEPSSFLAHRVIVVEGQTEEGLLRDLLKRRDKEKAAAGGFVSACFGVAICQGQGGTSACERASDFALLGYEVALLCDSDDGTPDGDVEKAKSAGVNVFRWGGGCCIETACISQMSADNIGRFVLSAVEDVGISEDSVLHSLQKAGLSDECKSLADIDWAGSDIDNLRKAVGAAAVAKTGKVKGWFKSVAGGIVLAALLEDVRKSDQAQVADFFELIDGLFEGFVYAVDVGEEDAK